MRVNPNLGGSTAVAESNEAAAEAGRAGGSSSSGVATAVASSNQDQAQLSGTHTLVQSLAAEASQLPEIRAAKVSALRQAVESGSYQANPEQVADALFSHLTASRAA